MKGEAKKGINFYLWSEREVKVMIEKEAGNDKDLRRLRDKVNQEKEIFTLK